MKTALCIRTKDFLDIASEAGGEAFLRDILDLPVTLEDRATCEADAGLLQLLPYACVVALGKNLTPQLLSYRRPATGGEGRLHGVMSIGFGGHVGTLPGKDSLLNHLHKELAREMKEELGLVLKTDEETLCRFANTRLVYNTSNDVGHHHLGILARLTPDDFEEFIISPEELDVSSLEEHTIGDLLTTRYDELESWSKIFIRLIAASAL